MIYSCEEFTIFDDIDEATKMWDTCESPLKIWFDSTKKKLMTTGSTGKTVSLTKTQLKAYDNPDVLLSKIKEHAGLLKSTRTTKTSTSSTSFTKQLHNDIVKVFALDPANRIMKLNLVSLLMKYIINDFKFDGSEEQFKTLSQTIIYENPNIYLGRTFDNVNVKDFLKIWNTLKDNKQNFRTIFDEIFKYGQKAAFKNSEWTPDIIADLMVRGLNKISEDYKPVNNPVRVYEPCAGMCNLTRAFKNIHKEPLDCHAYEIDQDVYLMSFVNDIVEKTSIKIYNKSARHGHYPFDFGLQNPPFTEKLNENNCVLKLVMENAISCNYSVNIFPENILTKSSDKTICYFERMLTVCDIPAIIRLGDNVFHNNNKKVGTGNVLIMFTKLKKFRKFDDDNEFIDEYLKFDEDDDEPELEDGEIKIPITTTKFKTRISNIDIGKYIVKKIRGDYYITDEGKTVVNNLIDNLTAVEETCLDTSDIKDWFKDTKTAIDILREKYNIPDNVSEADVLKYSVLRESYLKYLDSIMGIGNDDSYLKKVKLLEKVKPEHFVKVRLMDYFDFVKGKSSHSCDVSDSNGIYDVIGCKAFNNGVACKSLNYTFEASKEKPLYTIAGNGSVGYMFKHINPISILDHVHLMKNIQKLPNEKFNLELISLQLNNSGFGFTNLLTKNKLGDIEIYIYDKNNTSSESLKN